MKRLTLSNFTKIIMVGVVASLIIIGCTQKAPKCDDSSTIDKITAMLDENGNLTNTFMDAYKNKKCGALKTAFDDAKQRSDAAFARYNQVTVNDILTSHDKVLYNDSMDAARTRIEVYDKYNSCFQESEAELKTLTQNGKRYKLNTIRTASFNKDTGSYTCEAALETTFSVSADMVYKSELIDGGKNSYFTVLSVNNIR